MTDTLTDPLATPAVAHVDRMRGHRFRPPRADLNRIPPIYAQENTPTDEQIVHLHYFLGGNDWWITEYDPATGEAFGWARVGGNDRPELGYLNLPELATVVAHTLPPWVERDLAWTPKPWKEARP